MLAVNLILEDRRGVYIPRDFAQDFDHSQFTGYSWEDVNELIRIGNTDWENLSIDDSQIYWDIWDRILCNAEHIDDHGKKWILVQDMDVFLICPEIMNKEEKAAFDMLTFEEEEEE